MIKDYFAKSADGLHIIDIISINQFDVLDMTSNLDLYLVMT